MTVSEIHAVKAQVMKIIEHEVDPDFPDFHVETPVAEEEEVPLMEHVPCPPDLAIDDGIAIPSSRVIPESDPRWFALRPSQSFFLPGKQVKNMYTKARSMSKRLNRKFVVKAWSEAGIGGVRVWRVDDMEG